MFTKSDPTFGESDDLPDLPAWTRKEPNYLAFRSDGVSVQSGKYFFDFLKIYCLGNILFSDYPSTYNNVMLDAVNGDETRKSKEKTRKNQDEEKGFGGKIGNFFKLWE